MIFKNITVYALKIPFTMTSGVVETRLSDHQLQPCGSFEMESRGWLPPCLPDTQLHVVEREWLLRMGINQRILPGAVISQVTRGRAEKLAEKQGHPVGRKQLRELRGRVIEELMPKALQQQRAVTGWIDTVNGWLVLDTAAPKKAEQFMELLLASDVEMEAARLVTAMAPSTGMTSWLAIGFPPGGFTIDQDLELVSIDPGHATVRYVDHSLAGKEINNHIASGKTATKLGLTWQNRISFVLTDQGQIKRIRFLGGHQGNLRGSHGPTGTVRCRVHSHGRRAVGHDL